MHIAAWTWQVNCIIVYLICINIIACKAQWMTMDDPLLPIADKDRISASYNGSIFLIGGYDYPDQMIEYKIFDNMMYDHGRILFRILSPIMFRCKGQCHTQYDSILRFITDGSDTITVYNLETTDFIHNYDSIVTPYGVDEGPGHCLTSNDIYLFISGGWNVQRAVQVLILDTNTWFSGTTLAQDRLDHSCIVASHFLYVIGGKSESSVDKISINNIKTASWINIGSLTEPIAETGCVLYDNLIWIIGGSVYPNNNPRDFVHNIDIIDDSVTLTTHRLSYPVFGAETVIISNIIYVFGGVINSNKDKTNSWMKYQIEDKTSSPTLNPTSIPSTDPFNPTTTHPTTSAPTTDARTTNAPTSSTSLSATTPSPKTSNPTTALPTTAIPTTTSLSTKIPTYTIKTTQRHERMTAMPTYSSTPVIPTTTATTSSSSNYMESEVQRASDSAESDIMSGAKTKTVQYIIYGSSGVICCICCGVMYYLKTLYYHMHLEGVSSVSMQNTSSKATMKVQTTQHEVNGDIESRGDTFGQMLGDVVVGSNIMMDDIVEDMITNENGENDQFVPPSPLPTTQYMDNICVDDTDNEDIGTEIINYMSTKR